MPSFTVKAELQPSANKQGAHAIFIRITHNRKRLRVAIGKSVEKRHWDSGKALVRQTHPLASFINQAIKNKITEAEQIIFTHSLQGREPSLAMIKANLTGGSMLNHSVYSYAMQLIEQMRGKFVTGTLVNYQMEANRLEAYSPGITFDQIDNKWLKNYELHVREKGFKHNTIHKVFKTLAKFFNSAIKDGVTSHYPFKTFDRVKYRQGDRTYLTFEEITTIQELLNLPMDNRLRRAAVWFLFGSYSGLRFSDWQRFSPAMIRGNEIVLRAKKNGQLVVMPIHERLSQVIEMLPEVGSVEAEPNTNYYLKGLAKLCGIEKNLTTHVARHSFAVRCAELGISIETTSELMGINVKTCAIYYKVTGTKVKKEMERWDS